MVYNAFSSLGLAHSFATGLRPSPCRLSPVLDYSLGRHRQHVGVTLMWLSCSNESAFAVRDVSLCLLPPQA